MTPLQVIKLSEIKAADTKASLLHEMSNEIFLVSKSAPEFSKSGQWESIVYINDLAK